MVNPHEMSIFLNALERESPKKRKEFLNQACHGDNLLRKEVEELLSAHESKGHLLDLPPVALKTNQHQRNDTVIFDNESVKHAPILFAPGTLVGHYKLMEQIGEGGFGLVFVAEQEHPVKRRVAVKILKPGMDTQEVIARFEAERQALALMDHPNIASVFDAGTSVHGTPYFVMELVRGVSITEFCTQYELDIRKRLELFITVCNAVQHAHQKGVIHRDIKPSNILITLHDGKPVAKVIDFGIAKAIGPSLTDKTIYTRFVAMIGTPLYMSPEQAEMSGLDVDTRSDIYSLGVLLYELLTGSTPFDRDRLENAGLDEMRRIIREEEPPRPSTRITSSSRLSTTISDKRTRESLNLATFARSDLDWIVMKAIEKDRTRRYVTASAMAIDVQRFLDEEPIEARPPTALYRFRKFARRHKVTITTASLVATALVLGTVISVWQAARATVERNEKVLALNDAVQARDEANYARKQVEHFNERLKKASIMLTSGRAHADAGRWSNANIDYSYATEFQPKYYLVWAERGSFYARLGLWNYASLDYAKSLELGAPVEDPSWWGVPQLFWHIGNKQQYRLLCKQILATEQSSVQPLTWNAIRCCLLDSESIIKAKNLAEHAEELLEIGYMGLVKFPSKEMPPEEIGFRDQKKNQINNRLGKFIPTNRPQPDRMLNLPLGPGPHKGPNRNMLPRSVSLYIAGWANYRAGQFERAIDYLEQSNKSDPRWNRQGISHPVLAMAYHSAGRGVDAQNALAIAKKRLGNWSEQMSQQPVGTMPVFWFDWIEFVALHREATILITSTPPPHDPRLRAIEERALLEIQGSDAISMP